MCLRSIKVWSMMHFIGACHLQTEDYRLRLALSRAVVNLPSPVMLPIKGIETYNGEINLSNIIPRQICLEVLRTVIASCVYFKRILTHWLLEVFAENAFFSRRAILTVEQPSVVEGNFAPSFLLKFLSIFVHNGGSIELVTCWTSV